MSVKLTISLVVYHPDKVLLQQTLLSLHTAVMQAKNHKLLTDYFLTLVDNSVTETNAILEDLLAQNWSSHCAVIRSPENVGYGRGHNLSLQADTGDFHLIINPDVIVDNQAIIASLSCLQQTPAAGMVTPLCHREDGQQEYLCKAYPSVFTLLLRGFAPRWLKRIFQTQLANYDLSTQENRLRTDVMIASGCFMFLRQSIWQQLQGFDPRFFLYFEDFDLCLRLRQHQQIVFCPAARIVHYGGHSAKKGWRHISMFIRSAYLFFSLHGWRFY